MRADVGAPFPLDDVEVLGTGEVGTAVGCGAELVADGVEAAARGADDEGPREPDDEHAVNANSVSSATVTAVRDERILRPYVDAGARA